MATAIAVDQLGVDPDPRACLANTPLEDVADPEFGRDLGQTLSALSVEISFEPMSRL